MKKLVLMLLAFGFICAQTDKGTYSINGTAGFSTEKVENADESSTEFHIAPSIGYFMMDNLMVQAQISFASHTAAGEDDSSTLFSFGPSVRYYFAQENILPFAQVGYLYGSTEIPVGASTIEMKTNTINLGVGADFMMNKHIAIEAILNYNMQSGKQNDMDMLDVSGFNLAIGINYFIQ